MPIIYPTFRVEAFDNDAPECVDVLGSFDSQDEAEAEADYCRTIYTYDVITIREA